MKKVLINYSNALYRDAQKLNRKTGLEVGGFDKVICYSPKDLDQDFVKRNKEILSQEKGNGYWLWKPYIIARTLEQMNNDDYLFYCDSGTYFTSSIDPLIQISQRDKQDIILFELSTIEKEWTKRDAFVLMDCDAAEYTETKQRLGGYSLWRKSEFTLEFLDEYLRYSEDKRIITDMDNTLGLPNYDGFQSHRHDQSVISLLSKKYRLQAYRNPSQFGNDKIDLYENSTYGQLVNNTRKKNRNFISKVKSRLIGLIK